MTDALEELRAALLMITHKANEANIHRDEDDVLETIIEIARAALAAAPQPATVDRRALVEAIYEVLSDRIGVCEAVSDDAAAVADALLARGLRLPGVDETMAWAVVGEDGKIDPRKLWINSRDAEEYCERGERAVRVAIRVVEGGDDAA